MPNECMMLHTYVPAYVLQMQVSYLGGTLQVSCLTNLAWILQGVQVSCLEVIYRYVGWKGGMYIT